MQRVGLPSTLRLLLFAAANVLLLVISVHSVLALPGYVGLGFTWGRAHEGVAVGAVDAGGAAARAGLARDDLLLAFDGIAPLTPAQLELALLDHRAHDTVTVTVSRQGRVFDTALRLEPRYRTSLIVVTIVLGVFFWAISVFVFVSRPLEYAARVCAWAMVLLGSTIIMVWPGYPRDGGILWHAQPALYLTAYALIPGFILLFFLVYPQRKSILPRGAAVLLFIPGIGFGATLSLDYLRGMSEASLGAYASYLERYGSFRIYLVVYLLLSLAALIHSRVAAQTKANRHKVQWILAGIITGGFPFVALWSLPQAMGHPPIVAEELAYVFMLLIPLAFAFSIVRYHAFDIEVIVSRALGYAVVSALIIVGYLAVSGLAGVMIHSSLPRGGRIVLVASTLCAAMVFAPLRRRIQDIVDRVFYRTRYTYRVTMRELGMALRAATTRCEAFDALRAHMARAIPICGVTIVEREPASGALSVAEIAATPDHAARALLSLLRAGDASTSAVEPSDELRAAGIHAVVPISVEGTATGYLGIGGRLSGGALTEDDVELFRAMGEEAFMVAERMRLQEAVILGRAEAERLAEANRLKSEFLAHVSHELRTPLTSIRWSVENLLDGIPEPCGPRVREYLVGIHESGARLAHMIENLLDATRIDAQRLEVAPERLDLCGVVRSALDVVRPVAERKGVALRVACKEGLQVRADPHGLQTVLINLIDNAVKYSPPESIVMVETRPATADEAPSSGVRAVSIVVRDRGIGIPPERLAAIFEPFERVRCEQTARERGLGLGLHIVKQLVQRQNGRIMVASTPGVGSTFTVVMPAADTMDADVPGEQG